MGEINKLGLPQEPIKTNNNTNTLKDMGETIGKAAGSAANLFVPSDWSSIVSLLKGSVTAGAASSMVPIVDKTNDERVNTINQLKDIMKTGAGPEEFRSKQFEKPEAVKILKSDLAVRKNVLAIADLLGIDKNLPIEKRISQLLDKLSSIDAVSGYTLERLVTIKNKDDFNKAFVSMSEVNKHFQLARQSAYDLGKNVYKNLGLDPNDPKSKEELAKIPEIQKNMSNEIYYHVLQNLKGKKYKGQEIKTEADVAKILNNFNGFASREVMNAIDELTRDLNSLKTQDYKSLEELESKIKESVENTIGQLEEYFFNG